LRGGFADVFSKKGGKPSLAGTNLILLREADSHRGFKVSQSELVSVVVPAYNAQATLGRTLASVRAQTYANLEIVVVDDGSTDATHQFAEAEAREDPRIRVLTQANAGVAAARNAGIRASWGALLAPVDADDLWHPEKIAKQVAVIEAGGPAMGFVYTYFRRISPMDNAVTEAAFPLVFSGHVFLRHLLFNFVGNGSSILMRREAFESAGGYEPELQRQGA
jgi:glycosyltransferase involved in cell wall biosynthesis